MSVTAEPVPLDCADAGVIRQARRRQRRHRAIAAAALAAVLIPLAWSSGGGSRHARPLMHTPLAAPTVLAACAAPQTTTAAPSGSLLSILGVLRRAPTPSDALPAGASGTVLAAPFRQVFVKYVRRARELSGASYYVIAVRLNPCARHKLADAVSLWVFSGKEAYGVGGATAATIEQHGVYDSRGSGVGARATVAGLVPDGVASATLRYPAAPAHGPGHGAYPATTLTARAIDNVVIFPPTPRGAGLRSNATMTWRAADGTLIRTIASGL